jgi:hypothetical protein
MVDLGPEGKGILIAGAGRWRRMVMVGAVHPDSMPFGSFGHTRQPSLWRSRCVSAAVGLLSEQIREQRDRCGRCGAHPRADLVERVGFGAPLIANGDSRISL